MSTTKFAAYFTVLAMLLVASPAFGQREIRHFPPLVDPDGHNPDVYQPFVEPDVFNGDLQFFAPAEFTEFGNGPEANRGWFATYDRLYIWMSRPENQLAFQSPINSVSQPSILADNQGGDFTWGNRFDLGYMTAEDHGWLTSFWHIDGPNYFTGPTLERINVYEPNDEFTDDPQTIVDLRGGGGAGTAATGLNPLPVRDRNDPITGTRDFRIQNSVNAADLSSFEFNKTFRIHPLHYGSIVEPFVGFRYMKYSDFYWRDRYDRYDPDTGAALGVGIPVVNGPETIYTIEDLERYRARFDNHMVGGQLGLRWFKRKQKWNLSGEVRAFAAQNFQSLEITDNLERVYYDGVGIGSAISTVLYDERKSAAHASEFVIGTELRAEAAYSVTRDLSLRFGMAFMHMGTGVGRGNDIGRNSQDVTMVGGTFGVTVNR